MTVHLFGASSSPGCANYGLKQIATDNQTLYGKEVTQFIHHNFYVALSLSHLWIRQLVSLRKLGKLPQMAA